MRRSIKNSIQRCSRSATSLFWRITAWKDVVSRLRSPNENGDIEQRHYRLKESVDQALMLRGSRDFESREDYEKFLERLFDELNSGRRVDCRRS